MLKNQKPSPGFSIVEILVGMAMLGILSMAIAALISGSSKQQKRIELKDMALGINSQILTMINDSQLCRDGIVDDAGNWPARGIGTATGPFPRTLPMSVLQINQGGVARPIVTAGLDTSPGSTLQVEKIELVLAQAPNPIPGAPGFVRVPANLVVTYKMRNDQLIEMRPQVTALSLVAADAGTGAIFSCGSGAVLTEQYVCETMFDGTFNGSAGPPRCILSQLALNNQGLTQDQPAELGFGPKANGGLSVMSNAGGVGLSVYGTMPEIRFYSSLPNLLTNTPRSTIGVTGADLTLVSASASVVVNDNLNVNGTSRILNSAFVRNGLIVETGGATVSVGGLDVQEGGAKIVGPVTLDTAVSTLTVDGEVQIEGPLKLIGATTAGFFGGGRSSTGFNNMNATSFTASSDRRLKENIRPLPAQTELINQVLTYNYNFKSDSKKELHSGVIAQDIQKIYPHLVHQDTDGKLTVNYNELVPHLIKALQESNDRISKLEQRLNKIETKGH